jgi:hypothetical protein
LVDDVLEDLRKALVSILRRLADALEPGAGPADRLDATPLADEPLIADEGGALPEAPAEHENSEGR